METKAIKETETKLNFKEFKENKEKEQKTKLSCDNCGKSYKNRSGLHKHKKKCGVEKPKALEIKEDDDPEVEQLKEQLRRLVMTNPQLDLTKKITTNTDLKLIDSMEKEEIIARIQDFKRTASRKLNKRISRTALDLSGYVIGGILDCVQELQQEISKDDALQDAVHDVLSSEILCYVDSKILMLGLMGVDTGNAYVKSLPRKQMALELKKHQEELEKPSEPEPSEPKIEDNEKPEEINV